MSTTELQAINARVRRPLFSLGRPGIHIHNEKGREVDIKDGEQFQNLFLFVECELLYTIYSSNYLVWLVVLSVRFNSNNSKLYALVNVGRS